MYNTYIKYQAALAPINEEKRDKMLYENEFFVKKKKQMFIRRPAFSSRDREQCQHGRQDIVVMEVLSLPLTMLHLG